MLREATKGGRVIAFRYLSRMTGRTSEQRVQPHGILYGSRALPGSHITRSAEALAPHPRIRRAGGRANSRSQALLCINIL